MPVRSSPPAELIELLGSWRQFVCVGHVTPDADSLGAVLSFARAWPLGGNGRATVSLPPGSLSRRLAFMVELAEVSIAGPDDFRAAEGYFVADVARASRCSLPAEIAPAWPGGKPVANVDHHADNTLFGSVNWVAGQACSSCELVFELLRQAGRPIDGVTASLLYAGLLTDTVGFSLPATTASALRAAGDLVEHGADVRLLGERLNRSHSPGEFRLLRIIYDNTHLADGGRIAYSKAGYDEIREAGLTAADIDEQVIVPRSLRDIKVALLFTEGVKGKTRINFRGEQGTNVLELARMFGGGGHREAAGAVLECGVDEAVARVLAAAAEWLSSRPSGG